MVLEGSAAKPMLDVRGVTLRFKTSERVVTATYRIDLQVYRSDRYVVLGPSGCGKSTLLKAVGGYIKPVEGSIALNGQVISKPGLAIDVAGGIRSKRVIEVLSQLVSVRGAPRYLRSDNGPEFVSHAILKWIVESNIGSALIDPGKPWQNGTDESFNGRFRDECLTMKSRSR